jgi:hypothetical protein
VKVECRIKLFRFQVRPFRLPSPLSPYLDGRLTAERAKNREYYDMAEVLE